MTIKQLSQEDSDHIVKKADPLVSHLMGMAPEQALSVLLATTAVIMLAVKHKAGKTALDTLDDHFFPAVRKTVESELALRAAKPVVMDESKPHNGRIEKWHRVACESSVGPDLGFFIMGTLLDHPFIPVKHTNTSMVVKHDPATGEIETINSRYRLVGPEEHTP